MITTFMTIFSFVELCQPEQLEKKYFTLAKITSETNGSSGKICAGFCSDGTRALTGRHSGFVLRSRK
jgi:hypothetical protein